MKNAKKQLLQEIKKQLKLSGASAGEICTELLRLEKASIEGLTYYLDGLKQDEEIMGKFYDVNTQDKFDKVVTSLLNNGYEWVGLNKKPSFAECKQKIHGNGKLVIHAFYNDINNKKEMQFGTKSIYNTYPQYKGKIKLLNI